MLTKTNLFSLFSFLLLFNVQMIVGQHTVVIDLDVVANQIDETKIVSEQRALLMKQLTDIFSSCLEQLRSEFEALNRICISPQQLEAVEAEITYKQYKLYELDEKLDSLLLDFDQKNEVFIKDEIIKNLKLYLEKKEVPIGLILDKKMLLHCDDRIDFTSEVLQIMNEERDLELAKNKVFTFVSYEIEVLINRLKLDTRNYLGVIPENIDKEFYKKEIEAKTSKKGKKRFKYSRE